jgi:hypothetical protein
MYSAVKSANWPIHHGPLIGWGQVRIAVGHLQFPMASLEVQSVHSFSMASHGCRLSVASTIPNRSAVSEKKKLSISC